MPIYVALLRGVNVGPHKRMKMEKLRASFNTLGFDQVHTYIQSGNVIFKSKKASPSTLSKKIEQAIVTDFGFAAPVVVRTREEIGKVIAASPFLKRNGIDIAKLHVTFLPEAPESTVLEELKGLTKSPDESACLGREIFLHLPNGMAKSSLTNNPIERRLLKGATTRNWNTVNQLYEMCQTCE